MYQWETKNPKKCERQTKDRNNHLSHKVETVAPHFMACGCTHSRPASSTHNVRNNKNLKKKNKKNNKKFARGIRAALLITGHRSLYLLGHHIPSFIYFLAVSSSSRRRFWTSPQKKKKKRELANNNEKKNNFSWFYTQLPV